MMRLAGCLALAAAGCTGHSAPPPLPDGPHFAIIGDYGTDHPAEDDVARMVRSWQPDFVVTLGDNNYPNGERSTIDTNIGKYYSQFIGDYQGAHGPGSPENRFWPSIGNHEFYNPEGLQPYLDYFPALPGNRRYYDVRLGLVHLFILNSNDSEPDGVVADSVQAKWLHAQLAASDACFKLVAFHHPPYSSGYFPVEEMRWPFANWGADVVLSGHEHFYEHLLIGGFTYLINGLGGDDKFGFVTPLEGSLLRYDDDYGALVVFPSETGLRFQFRSVGGKVVDDLTLEKSCVPGLDG
jgi:hypothetical protein